MNRGPLQDGYRLSNGVSCMAGPRGANALRANTLSLADTKGGKNLSEQVICTKSAGNGAELCVDAPEVFCQ